LLGIKIFWGNLTFAENQCSPNLPPGKKDATEGWPPARIQSLNHVKRVPQQIKPGGTGVSPVLAQAEACGYKTLVQIAFVWKKLVGRHPATRASNQTPVPGRSRRGGFLNPPLIF
jgi:hypothetical protein